MLKNTFNPKIRLGLLSLFIFCLLIPLAGYSQDLCVPQSVEDEWGNIIELIQIPDTELYYSPNTPCEPPYSPGEKYIADYCPWTSCLEVDVLGCHPAEEGQEQYCVYRPEEVGSDCFFSQEDEYSYDPEGYMPWQGVCNEYCQCGEPEPEPSPSPTPSPPELQQSYLVLYAFHNPKETIIYNYWSANYPELAFIVVFPTYVGWSGDGRRLIEIDSSSEGQYKVKLRIKNPEKIPKELPFELINMTDKGYSGEDAWNKVMESNNKFRGFYYTWSLKSDLVSLEKLATTEQTYDGTKPRKVINGTNAPRNSEVEIDLTKGINVIAIKSWSYSLTNPDIKFELVVEKNSTPPIKFFGIPNKSVKVNIDNVEMKRRDIQWDERGVPLRDDFSARHGWNYTKNPGSWVVNEPKKRQYHEIINILTDVQRGVIPSYPKPENGLDWLEVAATEIYDPVDPEVLKEVWGGRMDNYDVTNCVWRVYVGDSRITGGVIASVSEWSPYLVKFAPFTHVDEAYRMRFNTPGIAYIAFHSSHARDDTIIHEVLHSYQHLPGKDVNDEEDEDSERLQGGDLLYVKSLADDQNKYFEFAFDNRRRGFLKENRETQTIDGKVYYKFSKPQRWGEKSLSGDSLVHDQYKGYFITKVNLTSQEVKDICGYGGEQPFFKQTQIPGDFPYIYPISDSPGIEPSLLNKSLLHSFKVTEAFLYKEGEKTIPLDDVSFITIYASPRKDKESYSHGYYYPTDHYFKFDVNKDISKKNKAEIYTKMERSDNARLGQGYSLYIIYEINYYNGKNNKFKLRVPPAEFDACFFGSLKHNPRK